MAGEIVSANLAEAIVKLIAVDVLPVLQSNLVMGRLINRDFDGKLAQVGDTVSVPIAPTMVANNIAEAGTVQNQSPNLGNAQVVLTTHAEATFTIPDVTKILTQPDLAQTYMDSAMVAIAERVEGDILGQYANLTVNAPIGANNVDISEDLMDKAETALFTAKVPQSEPKFLVVSGTQYGKIRQIPRFTENQTIGNPSPLQTGVISGVLKGFNIARSQLVKKVSTTVYNLAFARNAFVLVTRRLPLPLAGTGVVATYADAQGFGVRVLMSYNPQTLAQQFTVDILYGCNVLRGAYGQQLLSQ